MDKLAKKNEALMADIITLISELSTSHGTLLADWQTMTAQQRETAKREFTELEETITSKLMAVKYFRSLGDSFIKVSKQGDRGPVYLEIVTVYEGSQALNFAPEFEFQVQPLVGWYPTFRSCEPCSESEYQAAVELAVEKGAVVV